MNGYKIKDQRELFLILKSKIDFTGLQDININWLGLNNILDSHFCWQRREADKKVVLLKKEL